MRRKFLNLWKISFVLVFSFLLVSAIGINQTQSYYSSLGSYGLYGSYSGLLGGSGLYGLGSYGLYGGLGSYGLYGGYSGLYGGLYSGLYSGLYGGGLYGGLSSLLYGGLYGGGLYGGYSGLYGGISGGLYGSLYSPFGLQNMYYSIDTGTGLSYQVPFFQIAPLLGVAGLYNNLFPSVFGSDYARAAQQVVAALYDALAADPVLGPVLLADPVTLDILASDAALGAVVSSNPLWLSLHSWLVFDEPLLLSTVAVSCIQCHSNVTSGALLPSFPLPAQLI